MGKRLTISLIVFALVAVPLALYAAGYFWLGSRLYDPQSRPAHAIRLYSSQWLATVFRPMARLESRVSGVITVTLGKDPDDDGWQSYPPLPPD